MNWSAMLETILTQTTVGKKKYELKVTEHVLERQERKKT